MIRSVLLSALLLASPALAQSAVADLAEIDRAVARFTGAPIGAPGGAAMPVDRRLRLAPCRVPLALGWHGTRRDTVEVACPVAGGWRLYVPLAGVARSAAAAPWVARGDAVTITVSGEGFAVSQPGEALEAGGEGEWVKVRGVNPKAPVLRARVLRPGLVGIDLP
ncbi:MAG: flagella basal body P-ring formation protein FlgA [Novosphingobium sp.]